MALLECGLHTPGFTRCYNGNSYGVRVSGSVEKLGHQRASGSIGFKKDARQDVFDVLRAPRENEKICRAGYFSVATTHHSKDVESFDGTA